MLNFNKQRSVAVVYSCGTCNLNCRYCTIDKNPVLAEIDKELEESFKGDYYFNRIKEYFPRKDQLRQLETWGGEPFLHMDRVYPLVRQLIEYYPYFKTMYSSTNFSYDTWLDQFMGLMNVFGEYPYREFKYILQLSVDGPEYINDANRGIGVTKRCIANFDKLINLIRCEQFPKNVTLHITIKGTWDGDCIIKLNDKQKLIEFFQFYENAYIDKVVQLKNPKITTDCEVPNTAMPSPTTKQDGINFANLVRLCREIEQENLTEHYFKYYTNITPYDSGCWRCNDCDHFTGDIGQCGSGKGMVGFLPHNMVSACHEGFTLLVDKYKDFAAERSDKNLTVTLNKFFELQATPMCLTDDQYIEHERKMSYIDFDAPSQTSNTTTMIMALALAGLIEPKYLDEREALYAAKYILANTSFCIKVNYATTGSFVIEPTSLYILILNGALQYIDRGGRNNGCNFN